MLDDEPTPIGFPDAKKCAEKFLEDTAWLIENALNERNAGFLDEKDRDALEYARKYLRPAFEELVKWFVIPAAELRPLTLEYGFEKLWMLMSCCQIAGSRGIVSNSVENYLAPIIREKTQQQQGALARGKKAEGDAVKKAKLVSAIKKVVGSNDITVSEKFAKELRPDILKHLRIVEEKGGRCWPKVGTIKAALSAIKKEKT